MEKYSVYNEFITRLKEIRKLSTPPLEGLDDADAYSRRLRENFIRIGQLAAKNRVVLEERLFPLLKADRKLTDEEIKEIEYLEEKLLNAEDAENLDLPLVVLISERLLKEARLHKHLLWALRRMDTQLSICYAMMNITGRLHEYPEIAERYREEGLDIGSFFLQLREKESFRDIKTEEARELILTNARFAVALYENLAGDRQANEKNVQMLRDSIRVADDSFYLTRMQDYDWRYYRSRVLGYFAQLTELYNLRGIEEDLIPEICYWTDMYWDLWHADPVYYSEVDSESYITLHYLRNHFYAGRIDRETYQKELLKVYHSRSRTRYDVDGIVENFQIPIEILSLIRKDRYSEKEKALISEFYNGVTAYSFHMPNSEALSSMLEMIDHFLNCFIELPGLVSLEEMMLHFLAAMHPPTYVHSIMVAKFSCCLCGYLIDSAPELFVGVEGCRTPEEVIQSRDKILQFTWHAAICHDAGKLYIIDTVFVYGRKLLDMEFDLIKTHPRMGAKLLERFPSTGKYAEVALGHHKWYDNSRGYPVEFDTGKSKVKTVIDLVQCADCLDAATDTVGRSYSSGKSFEELAEEIREGSGTRYAPWVTELFSDPEVQQDIKYLLSEGRNQVYRDTYGLLKSLHEKEM